MSEAQQPEPFSRHHCLKLSNLKLNKERSRFQSFKVFSELADVVCLLTKETPAAEVSCGIARYGDRENVPHGLQEY
ncbi:hypothetical protein FF2_024822 [Malus domestica]